MLGDEQRLEELENKLAALSSQVEGLELEKQIDPFFEEDVRRLINDFREQEIIESQDLDVTEVSAENDAVISVTTAIDAPFKLHWIKPESCEAMTEEKARAAFAVGVEERIGTAQSVQTGDVLILLCREPISEESSSEDLPGSFCKFIGMAVDVLGNPNSKEPDAEDEHKITESAQSFEIFVWSSCECSGEESSPVTIPSALEKGSTSDGGMYLTPFPGYENESDTAEFLVSAEIRKDNVTLKSEVAKTISNTIEISEKRAGYNTKLVQLSEELTDFYLDREKKDYTIKHAYGYLGENTFQIDNYSTESLSLKTAECGNLQAVSISGTELDLFFLKEGPKGYEQFDFYWRHDRYLRNLVVSLGVSIGLEDSVAIESYRPITAPLENPLPEDESVFLPILDTVNADKIEVTDDFNTRDISTVSLFTIDESDAPLKDSKIILTKSGSQKKFASGLLMEQQDISPVSINSLDFPVIDKEYVKNWHGLGVSGLNLLSSATTKDSDNWNVSIGISLKYENLGFESGLLNSVGNTVSLGNSVNIQIPKGTTDNAVSIASDLSFTGLKKTVTDEGVTVSLGASWNSHHSQFTDGLFKGDSVDVPQSSESSFDLEITDLVDLGEGGTAGDYIKQLKDLSGSGHYNNGGSMDLQLEFQELRSQLGFNDSGFFTGEEVANSISQSVSIHVPAMDAVTFPSIGKSGLVNVDSLQDLTLRPADGGFTLHARYAYNGFTFQKGLFLNLTSGTDAQEGEMGYVSLGYIPFPEIPTGENSTISEHQLSSFELVSESNDSGTTYRLTYTPEKYSHNFEGGLLKSVSISSADSEPVSIAVPKGITSDEYESPIDLASLEISEPLPNDNGDTEYKITLTPKTYSSKFEGGLLKSLNISTAASQEVSFTIPKVSVYSPEGVSTYIAPTELFSDFTANVTTKEVNGVHGASYVLSLIPKELEANFEHGLTKDFNLNQGAPKQVSFFVPAPDNYVPPDGARISLSTFDFSDFAIKRTEAEGGGGDTYSFSYEPKNLVYQVDNGVVKKLNFTSGGEVSLAQSIFVPKLGDYNNNTGHTVRDISSIDVRGVYDHAVISSSGGTGETRYYIDYEYKDITFKINNGLVTDITATELQTATKGPIIVPGEVPLKYSCDPGYGCQPDPAGEYDEDTCGGNCTADAYYCDSILTFRPSQIYEYYKSGGNNDKYTLYDTWSTGSVSGPCMQQYVSESSGRITELELLPGRSQPRLSHAMTTLDEDGPTVYGTVFLSYEVSS